MSASPTIGRLKFASVVFMASGLLFALGAHPLTAWPLETLTDIVFWPVDGAQSLAGQEARLMAGICGGIMLGWGVMMWLVVTRLMPDNPALARLLITEGLLVWYVADGTASFFAGGSVNIALNTVLLALFLVPVWLDTRTGKETPRTAL